MVGRYISPSEFLRNTFISYGWASERITVLPNPIDANTFPLADGDDGSVIFAGRLTEGKGIPTLLAATALTPNIQYTIVGDGPLRAFAEKEKSANVRLLGALPPGELTQLLAKARLLVHPIASYENYPQIVLEAKALGKPVIASDLGAMRELLPEEMLVRAKNPASLAARIQSWYDMPATERRAHGQRLRGEVMQHNNEDEYIKKLLTIYASVRP